RTGTVHRRSKARIVVAVWSTDLLVDVDGLVLVEAQGVNVLDFQSRSVRELPACTDVELLRERVLIVRIHQATDAAHVEGTGGRRNGRHRGDAILPLSQRQSSTRNIFFRSSEVQALLE